MNKTEKEFKPDRKYAGCMDQIVDRVRLLIDILENGRTIGSITFYYEIVALNFRKILELIAYASILSHHGQYTAVHKKAEQHYKAKDILNEVKKFNPKFYPEPMVINHGSGKKDSPHKLEPRQADYLTRSDFIVLYDKCSDLMHVRNVLRDDQHINFIYSPKIWLKKITNLLDQHVIMFPDDESSWLVTLIGPSGKAHVFALNAPIPL